jgi:superfamily II DNA or RNA helicase
MKTFTDKKILDNLNTYSCKYQSMINKISKSTGKLFIYSNFKEEQGIKSIIRVLEAYGYSNYLTEGEGRKRFAVWSGDEDLLLKEEIINIFNRKNNLDGSKLKLLILSPAGKEGISLLGIRQIHIMEPYWNMTRIKQIIGRGSRYCSHKELDIENRNVKVYIYLAVKKDKEEQTIDEYINYLAYQKNKIIMEFENAVKESSIDCSLFYNANKINDENFENIKCDI